MLSWPRLLLLLALVVLPLPNARAGGPFDAELAAAISAGVVDSEVVNALESAERVRVIVYVSPRGREARTQVDEVIARLPAAELSIGRRFARVPAFAGSVTAAGLARLAGAPGVLRVSPDTPVRIQLSEAIPLVQIDALHGSGLTGTGRKMGFLDTGIDLEHSDFDEAIVAEQCFCQGADGPGGDGCCPNELDVQSGSGAAQDDHGHGTRVAGVAASAGVVADVGAAPDVAIVAVKVLDSSGNGSISDALAGLDWIAVNHPDADVANLSFGGGMYEGDCDDADAGTMALADAIDDLETNGTVVVASSGNSRWSDFMIAPACIAKAVSVGAVWDADVGRQTLYNCTDATTQADQVTCWSNASTTTDVFAPGGLITTSTLGGGVATESGTSYATPVVAGCGVLLREAHPLASAAAIARALTESPITVVDTSSGRSYPRLDCATALEFVSRTIPLLPAAPVTAALLALLLAAAGGHALWWRAHRASPRSSDSPSSL
jgi:subtilisin family serine protease